MPTANTLQIQSSGRNVINKIVILEGVGGSGKTTVLARICQAAGYCEIVETGSFIPDFPAPPQTLAQARRNERLALSLEVDRFASAQRAVAEGKVAIADRGPISTLSISYAMSKLGFLDTYHAVVEDCVGLVAQGRIAEASQIIYLEVDRDVAVSRMLTRDPRSSETPWQTPDAIDHQLTFFDRFFTMTSAYGGCDRVVTTDLSPEFVYERVMDTLESTATRSHIDAEKLRRVLLAIW